MAKQTLNLLTVQSQKVSKPANWEIVADEKKVTVIHKRGGHTVDFQKTFTKCEGVLILVGTINSSYAYIRTQEFQTILAEFGLTGVLPLDQAPRVIENYDRGTSHCYETIIGATSVDIPRTEKDDKFESRMLSVGANPNNCNASRLSNVIINDDTKWVIIKTHMEDRDIKRNSKYLYLKKGVKIESIIDELRKVCC